MKPCSLDHFKVEDTYKYFSEQDYSKLYCLDYNENIYLEGKFDSDKFSVVEIYFSKCIENCKDNE